MNTRTLVARLVVTDEIDSTMPKQKIKMCTDTKPKYEEYVAAYAIACEGRLQTPRSVMKRGHVSVDQ